MITSDPQARSVVARKSWETRRKQLEKPAFTRRDPLPPPVDYREQLRELTERVQLLEASQAEHRALLGALEERIRVRYAD